MSEREWQIIDSVILAEASGEWTEWRAWFAETFGGESFADSIKRFLGDKQPRHPQPPAYPRVLPPMPYPPMAPPYYHPQQPRWW